MSLISQKHLELKISPQNPACLTERRAVSKSTTDELTDNSRMDCRPSNIVEDNNFTEVLGSSLKALHSVKMNSND